MKTKAEREERLASQGQLRLVEGVKPYLEPRSAAYLRKLGIYVDSAKVLGKDDGLLDPVDADELIAAGVLVLDEEIAPRAIDGCAATKKKRR
jgi:hypothetical protein